MILTAFLIRHAPHGDVGETLSGRESGRPLTAEGEALACRLGEAMRGRDLAAVQSSPLERTMQTARAIAEPYGLEAEPVEALNEIDFGEWTGARFADLAGDPRWRAWNERRADGCCPGGERAAEAQRRVIDHLSATAAAGPPGAIAMVTHCDIIRAAVAHALGLTLDHVHRFEVAPASITEIVIADGQARLVQLNQRME
ncbi:MAG: histidine phosphatase family protein [Sphingomonas sp.]